MRIAVSGSHCTGKSTLIDEFLLAHPDFIHEPEPYTVLVEEPGEEFSAEPCVEDFLRQLQFNVERLTQHTRGTKVIYERCPIDFLAYIECLIHNDTNLVSRVSEAMQHLDLIVYLPIDNAIEVDEDEFPKLRKAVDRRLSVIYREDEFSVSVIEATGPTQNRLRIVEAAMKS
jgi:predicted ATPase